MFDKPTRLWQTSDLTALIERQVPEGVRLDYKASVEYGSEKGRREIAKDVSAFANTIGGRMIIGLKEHQARGVNVPVDCEPIGDVGLLQERLLDTLHDRCSPFVLPELVAIAVEGGHCLVVDIPESIAPVMVTGRKDCGYYHRVEWNSYPMTEREVRERYERMLSKSRVVEQLIEDAAPMRGWDPAQGQGQAPWLTVLAVPLFGPLDLFNPAAFNVRDSGSYIPNTRIGLASQLPWPRPTYFGLESLQGLAGAPEFLLRLHRTGVIEFHHAVRDATFGVHSQQKVRSANPTPLRMSGVQQGMMILDFLELAEGLYRESGYLSALHLRGMYSGLGGWVPASGGAPHGFQSPKAHSLDTSVSRLACDRGLFVHGLLDRVWQAAGAERFDEQLGGDEHPKTA